MAYQPILATLGYVLSPDRREVLMVHRNARPQDQHYGKFNGLGGKLHRDEEPVSCIKREIREEAAIECERIHLAGTISWPGFGKQGEDWFGFIFLIDKFSGTPKQTNEEGSLCWIPLNELQDKNLWAGDPHFLPLVFANPLRQFHGVMPYENETPISWHFTLL